MHFYTRTSDGSRMQVPVYNSVLHIKYVLILILTKMKFSNNNAFIFTAFSPLECRATLKDMNMFTYGLIIL
jgi:hypothetical protein